MNYQQSTRKTLVTSGLAAGAAILFAIIPAELHAQVLLNVVQNPPNARLSGEEPGPGEDKSPAGTETSASDDPVEVPPADLVPEGDVYWTATAEIVDGKIWNPSTGEEDKVRLRTYTGVSSQRDVAFVSPTVNIRPGNTFRLTINNRLPVDDPSCKDHVADVNVPHCFNSTNMHTHGLWVSPAGNSDNVLLNIAPGTEFTYEYNIPSDHPAGTFWYHPHLHGSTALQVSSGMAGALIIHGDRLPDEDENGDIDTLLVKEEDTPFPERVVLLQQIQYACWGEVEKKDKNGKVIKDKDGKPETEWGIKTNKDGNWICNADDVGTIDTYDKQFGSNTWKNSGRFTTINGLVQPEFAGAVAGKPERWRIIHAGLRESVNLQFRRAVNGKITRLPNDKVKNPKSISEQCEPESINQFSIATDGLTRAAIRSQKRAWLHPGYREDLLMIFPEPGDYCVIDDRAEDNKSVSNEDEKSRLLGFVSVTGTKAEGDTRTILENHLVAAAETYRPARDSAMEDAEKDKINRIVDEIVSDLKDGLKLTKFMPHQSLMEVEPDNTRTIGFNIVIGDPIVFQIGKFNDKGLLYDAKPFDPNVVNQSLPLGATEDWEIRSFIGAHPFHIHVNPFQIVEILDHEGKDVSGHDPGNTSIYAGLKGAWKDTIIAAREEYTVEDENGNKTEVTAPYRLKVRSHYERYIGKFVLHCHILDHEDKGMMQIVEIGLPDGKGGIRSAHH